MIGVLGRYLVRQNMYLMAICLMVGTCIYLLSDMFDRLDDFYSAGVGGSTILYYYLVKIPLIISQLLPAIFLLAMVIQLGVLTRSREMLALRAGGVAFAWFVRFFFVYALIWSAGQLVFSQYLGVWGETEATRIWKEDVRKKQLDEMSIQDLWLRDGPYIVLSELAHPAKNKVEDVTVYEFAHNGQELTRIISASKGSATPEGWVLYNVTDLDASTFGAQHHMTLTLPINQILSDYAAIELKGDKAQLPLYELSRAIKKLEQSGSNVEILRTAWHGKWAYAFSIAVMALLALALSTFSENVYANIGYSLILIFVQYGLHVVGATAGEKGVLEPFTAAWMGNITMGTLAVLRLSWTGSSKIRSMVGTLFVRTRSVRS